jgi:hypothetical protein
VVVNDQKGTLGGNVACATERHQETPALERPHERWPMKTLELPTTPKGHSLRAVVQRFADWSDAFSVCREMDKPITVAVPVNDVVEVARIFPSGRCKHLRYESQKS